MTFTEAIYYGTKILLLTLLAMIAVTTHKLGTILKWEKEEKERQRKDGSKNQ